jgi:hypothetical protein
MIIKGRGYVRNTRRGNHLGQGSSATTPKGRTYGSKRSDQNICRKCLQAGAVHIWTYNNERPNMGIGGITPAQKLKMAA